jgi:hypothetical protein
MEADPITLHDVLPAHPMTIAARNGASPQGQRPRRQCEPGAERPQREAGVTHPATSPGSTPGSRRIREAAGTVIAVDGPPHPVAQRGAPAGQVGDDQ